MSQSQSPRAQQGIASLKRAPSKSILTSPSSSTTSPESSIASLPPALLGPIIKVSFAPLPTIPTRRRRKRKGQPLGIASRAASIQAQRQQQQQQQQHGQSSSWSTNGGGDDEISLPDFSSLELGKRAKRAGRSIRGFLKLSSSTNAKKERGREDESEGRGSPENKVHIMTLTADQYGSPVLETFEQAERTEDDEEEEDDEDEDEDEDDDDEEDEDDEDSHSDTFDITSSSHHIPPRRANSLPDIFNSRPLPPTPTSEPLPLPLPTPPPKPKQPRVTRSMSMLLDAAHQDAGRLPPTSPTPSPSRSPSPLVTPKHASLRSSPGPPSLRALPVDDDNDGDSISGSGITISEPFGQAVR